MKTQAAPPYLLPPVDCVEVGTWLFEDGSEVPDRLEHWDPNTDLWMTRAVTVDADRVRETCGLDKAACLSIIADWRSNRTRRMGTGEVVEFGNLPGRLRAPLAVAVPGAEAGGALRLRTSLILRRAGDADSPIAPRRTGSVLWSESDSIAMEGSAARFPTTALLFEEVPWLANDASWALDWNTEDLDVPVLGGLRLLINASDSRIVEAVRSGSDRQGAALIRSFLRFDVARALVTGALTSHQFQDSLEVWSEESVGRMISDLIARTWPSVSVPKLAERLRTHPARLDAELQAAIGVMG